MKIEGVSRSAMVRSTLVWAFVQPSTTSTFPAEDNATFLAPNVGETWGRSQGFWCSLWPGAYGERQQLVEDPGCEGQTVVVFGDVTQEDNSKDGHLTSFDNNVSFPWPGFQGRALWLGGRRNRLPAKFPDLTQSNKQTAQNSRFSKNIYCQATNNPQILRNC